MAQDKTKKLLNGESNEGTVETPRQEDVIKIPVAFEPTSNSELISGINKIAKDKEDADEKPGPVIDDGLLVLEFGNHAAEWTDIYPCMGGVSKTSEGATVKLKSIDSKHVGGCRPLSAIRLIFTNDTCTPWFETKTAKEEDSNDIEERNGAEIDMSRSIRQVSARVSLGNAICALNLADEKDDTLFEIEWETFDLGRQWKTYKVPEDHEIIGIAVNATEHQENITRLGFICKKS